MGSRLAGEHPTPSAGGPGVDLAGRRYVVTGGNAGIGRATAEHLALSGASVVLACRSKARAQPVVDGIRARTGNPRVELALLDLGDLASVKACAEELRSDGAPIHGLINNAGLGGRGRTGDGFELHFGVNYLGHFLLTLELMPRLRAAAAARIVNVSSGAHFDARAIDFDAVRASTRSLTGWREYAVSKLANVLFTRSLARRLEGTAVSTYALHPGAVATDAWRRVPRVVAWLCKPFLLTPEQGAKTTLHCALSEQAGRQSGSYYVKCAPREPSSLARDDALGDALWRQSLEWTGATDLVATAPSPAVSA